ncbi:hypothetical protein DL96DRAFT_1702300 [Flagelloscypha sp. PMI_526]|nr:hypothetical protein DL96DRAFT_1702300 [Flagelloscypha sp. PMI_526]
MRHRLLFSRPLRASDPSISNLRPLHQLASFATRNRVRPGFTALSNASSSIPFFVRIRDDDPLSDTETMVMQPLSRHKHKNSDSVMLLLCTFLTLDKHLASIPRPEFADRQSNYLTMFSPMDKLVASKLSLDDLEHNGKVAPGWRNRSSLLSDALSTVLGAMGSSLITTYYSLTGVANTVQIFALIISTLIPMFPEDIPAYWRELLLGTIPNVLALNFASGVIPSLIFLLVFMCLAGILLYYFRRTMLDCERYKIMEGLQSPKPSSQWGAILGNHIRWTHLFELCLNASSSLVTFLLTLIYLPLSTLSVHVLVWSSDLWVVKNPYINATSIPPALPPLGPTERIPRSSGFLLDDFNEEE